MNFQLLIEEIKKATSLEMLREIIDHLYLSEIMFSFCYVLFRLPGYSIPAPLVITHYPSEWINFYMIHEYYKNDPVLLHAKQNNKPFLWSESFFNSLTDQQHKIFEDSDQYSGIVSGVTVPLYGPYNEFAIVTSAMSHQNKISHSSGLMQYAMPAFSLAYHEKVKKLLVSEGNYHTIKLSSREIDCLLWAAKGKTSWETSKILHLSEETVRTYIKNSLKKLNATNKTQAIVKCFMDGIISTSDLSNHMPILK